MTVALGKQDGRADAASRAGDLDQLAGRAVRLLRERKGMSRAALGRACGVSGQQIEKYELAANRMAISRFQQIAAALGADPAELMGSLTSGAKARTPLPPQRRLKAAEMAELAARLDEETLEHLLGLGRRLAG